MLLNNENYQRGREDRERELIAASITSLSKRIAITKTIEQYFELADLSQPEKQKGKQGQSTAYPRRVWVYLLAENGFSNHQIKEITGYSYSNVFKIREEIATQKGLHHYMRRDIEHLRTRILGILSFNHTN